MSGVVMGRSLRSGLLLTCCSLAPTAASCALAGADVASAPGRQLSVHAYRPETASSLWPAEGELRRIFEVGFSLDPRDAPQVSGLRSAQSAVTVEGGLLDVAFDAGVPHPTRIASTTLFADAALDPSSIADMNLAPPLAPRIGGAVPMMTFRVARRTSEYLGVWHAAGGVSLVAMFDTAQPLRQPRIIARSHRRVLGIAVQPDVDATRTYFTVWIAGRRPGQFVIGSYGWGDRDRSRTRP